MRETFRLPLPVGLAVLAIALAADRTGAQDGAPDPLFGAGTGTATHAFDTGSDDRDRAHALAVLPDGRILVAGSVGWGSSWNAGAVARFFPDGTLDTSFANGGELIFQPAANENLRLFGLALQPDGRFVVAGTRGNQAFIARRLANGAVDPTCASPFCAFGLQIGTSAATFEAVALAPSGKIVAAGRAEGAGSTDMLAIRLHGDDFSFDDSFAGDGSVTVPFDLGGTEFDTATAVAVTGGGKVVLAGWAEFNGFDSDFAVAVLLQNGALDPSFSADGKVSVPFDFGGLDRDEARALALQPDGRIVVGGWVERAVAGDIDFALARLTPGGNLDPSFGGGDGRCEIWFDLGAVERQDFLHGLTLQSDGKIVAVGSVATGDPTNVADFGFARVSTLGVLDPGFGGDGKVVVDVDAPGATGNGSDAGMAVKLQSGRPIAAGLTEKLGADTDFALVRLTNALIFRDGFATGNTSLWSQPAP